MTGYILGRNIHTSEIHLFTNAFVQSCITVRQCYETGTISTYVSHSSVEFETMNHYFETMFKTVRQLPYLQLTETVFTLDKHYHTTGNNEVLLINNVKN